MIDMDKKPHTASHGQEAAPGKQEEWQENALLIQEEGKHGENSASGQAQERKEGQKEDKLSALTDQLLRLQAEFDNYKKRTVAEKERLSEHTEAKLMLRMLPIYEELGLATQEAGKIHDEALRKGILLVLGKLRSTFEKEGLSRMEAEGEKFDPYKHDAAMTQESELPEGEIVRCISQGYLFRGNILRHALVAVSSGKKKEDETGRNEGKEGKEGAKGQAGNGKAEN
jgi:molecular chaperone GrpE